MFLKKNFLENVKIRKDLITFLERNNLLEIPFFELKITGDYRGYFHSLKNYIRWSFSGNGELISTEFHDEIFQIHKFNGGREIISSQTRESRLNLLYEFKYDSEGNILNEIIGEQYIYYYEYDKNGNLTREYFPNGTIVNYKLDENGNPHLEQREFEENSFNAKRKNPQIISWAFIHEEGRLSKIYKNEVLVCKIELKTKN